MFRPPLDDYHIIIHLHKRHVPRREQAVDARAADLGPKQVVRYKHKCTHLPVVDFDPVEKFVHTLEVSILCVYPILRLPSACISNKFAQIFECINLCIKLHFKMPPPLPHTHTHTRRATLNLHYFSMTNTGDHMLPLPGSLQHSFHSLSRYL